VELSAWSNLVHVRREVGAVETAHQAGHRGQVGGSGAVVRTAAHGCVVVVAPLVGEGCSKQGVRAMVDQVHSSDWAAYWILLLRFLKILINMNIVSSRFEEFVSEVSGRFQISTQRF